MEKRGNRSIIPRTVAMRKCFDRHTRRVLARRRAARSHRRRRRPAPPADDEGRTPRPARPWQRRVPARRPTIFPRLTPPPVARKHPRAADFRAVRIGAFRLARPE
ncbi:hypothetical protein [Burkholderia pseudomallei]|uniref:hypothetical protein n=2 Tax=Burkholderia pseudomallei TaxID=28450 RepID=UPI0028A9A443|nr:hypothetical protein [Burkholderia pseudomallei]